MTIHFKKSYISKIINGEKTATRRPMRPMVKLGGEYNMQGSFYTNVPDRFRTMKRLQQRLGDMSHDDVLKEGFRDLDEFREEWKSIYGAHDPDQLVWVVEFQYLKPTEIFKLQPRAHWNGLPAKGRGLHPNPFRTRKLNHAPSTAGSDVFGFAKPWKLVAHRARTKKHSL